jgi:predicted transcriptional regulator
MRKPKLVKNIRPGDLPALSDGQLEIMQVVWEKGEVTVSEVWETLAARRDVARNTVLTLMDRLEKKGWLSRHADGQTHRYRAAVSRQSTLGDVVHRLVETAFSGSADSLMLALLEGRGVSEDEAKRIRALIDKARKK